MQEMSAIVPFVLINIPFNTAWGYSRCKLVLNTIYVLLMLSKFFGVEAICL